MLDRRDGEAFGGHVDDLHAALPQRLGLAVVERFAIWGIALGAFESTIRATVARLVPARSRGTAYGTFNAIYGRAIFLGGVALGAAYGRGPDAAIGLAVGLDVAALAVAAVLFATRPPSAR